MKGRSRRLQSHDLHEDWVDGSWTVDCVCGVNFDDGEEMVNCDECGVWVHTRCSRYVKGEELFTCDKCKSKNNNNRDESEETEVAQLLVELPTKTIRLESSSYVANGQPHRPFRLWTDMPIEERVHVQGIPGGDPSLFSGLSSVFTPELWKCSGYVPKKFNFQYREFPCWDEKEGDENGNEQENTVDKGAGVLFSLAKESVLATPAAALVGMKGTSEEGIFNRKQYSRERRSLMNEDSDVRHLQIEVTKERSLLRPIVIHSGKRKKDQGASKERSGKKKARAAYKEADTKKRVSHVSRTAFTSTSDAKPLEFYEDRGPKSIKNDNQGNNKNVRDSTPQEYESEHYASADNVILKPKSSLAVIDHSSDVVSSGNLGRSFSTGAEPNEGKASHEGPEATDTSSKFDNAVSSTSKRNDVGGIPAKQEGNNMPNGNLEGNMENSGGSNVRPLSDEQVCSVPEFKEDPISADHDSSLSSFKLNVKVDVDDGSRGVLNVQSSIIDVKDVRVSCDNTTENIKRNSTSLNGTSSGEHKAQELNGTSEAASDCHAGEQNELISDSLPTKQEVEGSEGSFPLQKCPSEPKLGSASAYAAELSNSGSTSHASGLPNQNKLVVYVGKSYSSSAAINSKSSAGGNFRSTDLDSNSNAKQQITSECNSNNKKDQAASDMVKLRNEDNQSLSRRAVKECPKSCVNSASKLSNSSKIPHTSVLKRTISDSKDSAHNSSSKTSLALNSCETTGLQQNEGGSQLQNKASSSGLPLRSEKFNQSCSQSSSKANHTSSMNPPSANSSATLSDEELALLLHQELNSSPRVPRVPRVRHAGSLPHMVSPTATSMLIKRTSSSGGRDHILVSRRKNKDASKDVFSRTHEPDDEAKKADRMLSSPDQRRQDLYTVDEASKREEKGSPTAAHPVKKSLPPASTSTANSGPSSSAEVNDHNLSSIRNSPRNMSDEETGTARGPVHLTLPGLINEIMSKGKRMTYEELCNAVLPHWHNLRKHNGERYAYSSHSQAVLDCLRNRHEWAQLVDRGPKTNSSRKRRKLDPEESEDNDYGKGKSAKEGEGKILESQREEFPKGKRKARKRRHLALQGRRVKEIRKRRKSDYTDDDSGPFSNSSEESLFSEDEIRGTGAGQIGSEASATSDEAGTM